MSPRAFFLLLWLVPMFAWAATMPGIRLYERGEYAKASRSLKAELKNPRRSEADRARARVYLAASLLALKKGNEARQQLEALALTTAQPQVDPALFPPELVEMEKQVRGRRRAERVPPEPDPSERDRLAAQEADRLMREQEEAERHKREQEAAARNQTPVAEVPRNELQAPLSAEPVASFRLRPEVTGYVDMWGSGSWGFGVGATVGFGALDASARFLPAPEGRWGLSVDVGYLFGRGMIQPRVALRGTGVAGVGVGGGAAVGARLTPLPWFTWMVDVGIEKYSVRDAALYRDVTLVASTGLGINLF
ncbi:hypothetical protein KYC5002_42050 [Archangium violaceum]|uniref:hypothetical protein n=1 Tax=Archangium violaceum TaxID=83451 RepID=UPI002B2D92F2|nr:hypothetical protein KYC5002_42050 [Archangium gephyra]